MEVDYFKQGATKFCVFGGCRTDSRRVSTPFLSFPKPCLAVRRQLEIGDKKHIKQCILCAKSELWLSKCKREDYSQLLHVKKWHYICVLHFVNEVGPTAENPFPLPASEASLLRIKQSTNARRKRTDLKSQPVLIEVINKDFDYIDSSSVSASDPLQVCKEEPNCEEGYTCNLCPYFTTSNFLMKSHVKFHSLIETFSCANSALKAYNCKDCDFKTDLLVFLKKHIQQFHLTSVENTLQSFICRNCTFETYSALHWLHHFKVRCSSTEPTRKKLRTFSEHSFECCHCGFKTSLNRYLTKHMMKWHSERNWLKCDHCKYKTKSKEYLNRHVIIRHTEWKDTDLFHCDKCTFKAKLKQDLRYHNICKHLASEEIQWFQCDKCSFKAKTKKYLKKHNSVHLTCQEIRWFQCDKCSFKTKDKSTLKTHNINQHLAPEEIQWFQCEKCPFKAKSKKNLGYHSRRLHLASEQIQWLQCDKCPYKTKFTRDFKSHTIRKHSDKNKVKQQFTCSQCPFKANKKYLLNNHVKHEHESGQNVKLVECYYCSYKSEWKHHLRKHILKYHTHNK